MRTKLIFALGTLLVGCATAYQPQGLSGGFSETQLDKNVFKVTFRGNGYTSVERAEDLTLLRSADLALSNGFSHFVIVDSRSRENTSLYTSPTRSSTTFSAFSSGGIVTGSARTRTTGGDTMIFRTPSTSNTIVGFKERPNTDGMVYDARFICDSLGAKYKVTCGAQ